MPMPDAAARRPGLPWQANLVLLALIWGSSFLLIKVALADLGPIQVAAGRILLGALVLHLVLALTRGALPRDRTTWKHAFVAGLIMNALPFTLIAWGETRLGSIPAGIWNATTPLLTLLVMLVLIPSDPPTMRRIVGLLTGFSGVLLVLAPWQGLDGGTLAGHLAFCAAASCYAVGTPYSQRFLMPRPGGIAALSAAHLSMAALVTSVAALGIEGAPARLPSTSTIGAMLVLGVLGTGVAYLLFNALVREAGSTTAASVTYLIPLVSTTLGVTALHEPVSWHEPVGMACVLAGVSLSSSTPRARRGTPRS